MNVLMSRFGTVRKPVVLAVLLLTASLAGSLEARTVLTCENAQGERFFSERCPPGTVLVETRRVATGAPPSAPRPQETATAPATPATPSVRKLQTVTVYSAPDCVPCDFVERHLQTRRVAFTRMDVEADPAAFDAIRGRLEKVGVPVLTVGESLLTGFQPQRIDEVLVAEGVLLATDVPQRSEPAGAPVEGDTEQGATPDAPTVPPDLPASKDREPPAGTARRADTPVKPEDAAPQSRGLPAREAPPPSPPVSVP